MSDLAREFIKSSSGPFAKKGFITIEQSPLDTRAMCICPTELLGEDGMAWKDQTLESLEALFFVQKMRGKKPDRNIY